MKIYTTYFANVRNLPDEVVPIAIWLNSAGYDVNEFGADNEKA